MALPVLAAVSIGAELIKLAPSLFKLFGDKPPPEIVTRAAEIAQSVTGSATPEEALQKIKENDELRLKYQDAAEARSTELVKAYLADTQSARNLYKGDSATIIGSLAIAAIMGVIICLAIVVWKTDLNEIGKASISLILGRCLGWVEQVYSFFLGSTKSSQVKDSTIATITAKES